MEVISTAVIKAVCDAVQPTRVLEWGPGRSTERVLEVLPAVNVVTIEHDEAWYWHERRWFRRYPNVRLMHIPHLKAGGQSQGYSTYPLRLRAKGEPKWDIAIVDGRSRCDCITVASLVVKGMGVVIVHDSDRPNYVKAVEDVFPYWRQVSGSTLLASSERDVHDISIT